MEKTFSTKKTITVTCNNPFKKSNSKDRIYQFIQMLGATIGTGLDCPVQISHTLNENEDAQIVEMQMRAWLGNAIELAESFESKVWKG